MGFLKWYKRDPRAALIGMACLTLEERGAYNTILDQIYCHDGEIDDHERLIAGWLNVDVRIWRRIRAKLITAKKLYETDGKLRNERADKEVTAAQHRYLSSVNAGTISALKRGAKNIRFNGLPSTGVPTGVPTQPESRYKKEDWRGRK
jgi:uncharacterized protein YdaU (DUF1376 family)